MLRDIARMGFQNREGVLSVGASVAGMTFVSGNSHLSDATWLWRGFEGILATNRGMQKLLKSWRNL